MPSSPPPSLPNNLSHRKTTNIAPIFIDTPIPRRKRSSSSPKPLYKTILSIFFKNSILVLILLILFQMFRNLSLSHSDVNDTLFVSYEKRIADRETFLKTSIKIIQEKVDSVDLNILNEANSLKTDLTNRIDDNVDQFEARLRELEKRVEGVEKSETKWLTRDEFDKLVREFDGFRGLRGLGEVRELAKEVVVKEIEKHAADGVGMIDYAAASGGGVVVDHSESVYGKSRWWKRGGVSGDAVKMLQPSFGEPGQCFAIKGDNGFVEIKLRTFIIPEAVTLEHVDKSVAFDRSSAPKDCRVFGWLDNKGTMQRQLLTDFVYDLEKSNAQTFIVLDSGSSSIIDTIRLELTSNHGNPTHTCIYRLRVHGQEPHSLSSLTLES